MINYDRPPIPMDYHLNCPLKNMNKSKGQGPGNSYLLLKTGDVP